MSSPIGCLAEEDRALLERAEMPESVSPMLATLTEYRFSSDDWIFERKLDGVRCLAFHGRRGPRLVSRGGNVSIRLSPSWRRRSMTTQRCT